MQARKNPFGIQDPFAFSKKDDDNVELTDPDDGLQPVIQIGKCFPRNADDQELEGTLNLQGEVVEKKVPAKDN